MAEADISNSHNEEIVRYEHSRKNVGVKRSVIYGYDADTDNYYPITATDNGDGTYSISSRDVSVDYDKQFSYTSTTDVIEYQLDSVAVKTKTVTYTDSTKSAVDSIVWS